MAHIQRRRLPSGRVSWRVRYVDPDGTEKSRSFKRKVDAEDFATEVSHTMRAGSYVDPAAGRQTVRAYLEEWQTQQGHVRPRTLERYRTQFGNMVYPLLGDRPLSKVAPSTIRSWQTALLETYEASTVVVVRGTLSGAFADAVLDRRIAANPFGGVPAPQTDDDEIVPLTVAQLHAGERALLARYAAVIPVGSQTGLRWGELFGLTVDRVDFLRKTIRVDRQLVGRDGPQPLFGPPKSKKGRRTVPVATITVDALAAHLAAFPAEPDHLVFRTSRGTPMTRGQWAARWAPARTAMGLPEGKGIHQLRHFYASALIAQNRSVKEVQERLGDASAQITLDTYGHLWPNSDDGTRAAIEAVFTPAGDQAEEAEK